MKRRNEWAGIIGVLGLAGLLAGCTTQNPSYCESQGYCSDDPANVLPDLAEPGLEGPDLQGALPDLSASGDLARDLGGATPDLPAPSFDPGVPGPEKTLSFDTQVRLARGTVSITVIGPTDDGKELTLRAAPRPLVLISPGFTVDRKQYTNYATRLASYGLVAVLQKSGSEFNHAAYRDGTIELITWLGSPTGGDAARIKGRVDLTRLGLAGHSLGGKISILVAAQDTRVKALFGIDPVDANTPSAQPEIGKIKLPTGVPMGFVGETTSKTGGMPCAPASGNYEVLYGKAAAPAFAITLVDAAHNDVVDNFASCPTCGFCPGGTAPKDRTNRLAVKYTAAYFLWALQGDVRARDYFAGAAFQKDITDGYITRVTK
jgi:pimeloyl-ACP methyl ester carboxylesterase